MLSSPFRSLFLLPALVVVAPSLPAADLITTAGHGEMVVETKGKTAQVNQKALELAESNAVTDALAQALHFLYGNRAKLGADHDRILREVVDHKATFLLATDVRSSNIESGKAVVEVAIKVDGNAFRKFLENSLNLSLAQEVEGKFKVIVLAYTSEGMDANRAKPPVLLDEVVDNRQDIHASAGASLNVSASSKAKATYLKATGSTSDKGKVAVQANNSVNAYQKDAASVNGSGSASQEMQLKAKQSSSGSAEWNYQDQASVDARTASSSAAYAKQAQSSSTFDDNSSQYHRITIYADTTKKGAGSSNEVRAALGEILEKSGLNTKFVDMNLMGRTFETEDQLYLTIRDNLKKNPDIAPGDYVAVALNRVTPVNEYHRYTSQVIYRVLRIKDGDTLLPDKVVTGDSGDEASDDLGRAHATQLAIRKADSVLPDELRSALRKVARAETRETAAAATTYIIRVDNIQSPMATLNIKQALRNGGFAIKPEFRGDAHSETIYVDLKGKTGMDVMAVIEPLLGRFVVNSMDDKNTLLKAM